MLTSTFIVVVMNPWFINNKVICHNKTQQDNLGLFLDRRLNSKVYVKKKIER